MTSLELFARIAAVFGFATLGVAILMTIMAPFTSAVLSAGAPILAVELPIATGELTALIKDHEVALRCNTRFDGYLIAAYTAMFISWALLLPGNRLPFVHRFSFAEPASMPRCGVALSKL